MDIVNFLSNNRIFFDGLGRGILITDMSGKILWKNKPFDNHMEIAYMISENASKLMGGMGRFEFEGEKFEIVKTVLKDSNKEFLLFILNIKDILETRKNQRIVKSTGAKYTFDCIIGQSKPVQKMLDSARKAARTDSNVLIHGETGTGKELIAQSIHADSSRRTGRFIAVNCSAVPEELMESTFFGSVKGAFTGAEDKKGLFEMAVGGTIFLDEINSMPLNLQSKLLRVIQEGTVRRVGGTRELTVDSRIISAMNENPFEEVESGKIRKDLLYRLGVVFIAVPSLRERKEDIVPLTEYFLEIKSRKQAIEMKPVNEMVYNIFADYEWEGNVRQLEHVVESALVMARYSREINVEHLPSYMLKTTSSSVKIKENAPVVKETLQYEIERVEKNRILYDLEKAGGNMTRAAEALGISRQNLYKKMKKYNIKVNH